LNQEPTTGGKAKGFLLVGAQTFNIFLRREKNKTFWKSEEYNSTK
jgi:hypothetical protein